MTWNYRIVEYINGSGFGLHRVHYDRDDKAIRMSAQPVGFADDSPEEIRSSLMLARMDAHRRPVFKEPEGWTE